MTSVWRHLAMAQKYAAQGLRVFPCRGKLPLTPRGFHDATTDRRQITRRWREHPDANIGAVPGPQYIAIDIDSPEAKAEAKRLGLYSQPCPWVKTARGEHLWFRHPDGAAIGNPKLGRLDVRADAGYVMMPPSVHPDGPVYSWGNGSRLADAPGLPPKALAALTSGRPAGSARKAAPLPEVIYDGHGRRNHLMSLAGSVRRRGADRDEILALLQAANSRRCRPPLDDREVEKIADSAMRYKPAPSPSSAPPAQTVSPPTQPMRVARELVKDLYTTEGGLVLRDHNGEFYRYDGTCWPEIDRRLVRTWCYTWLETAVYAKETEEGTVLVPWDPTRRKIDDVVDALRAVVMLDGGKPPLWSDDTTDPPADEIVSVANGLLHVPTRTLQDHTPRYFNHHALPFDFDPGAPEPEAWLRFLGQLWPEDASSIAALQEVCGYILAGNTRQQKIFLFVGPRRGGKGTIGRVLTGLLGAHNVAAPTMASLATNFGLQPLIGRPLGLISDARLSRRTDSQAVVERLLSISGEDSLTIDRKYRDPWTGRLPTRFMVLTNELPRLSDSSGALASRFVLFVMTRSFLGREDPGLTDKLLAEAPGIFNWALEGVDRLNERGYFEMPTSAKEAVQQLEDLSSPVSAFVRDHCTVGTDQHVAVDVLWVAWKSWCEAENRHPGTKAVFGRDLRAVIPTLRKTRPGDTAREHAYVGIGPGGNTMHFCRDCRDGGQNRHSSHGDGALYLPPEASDAWASD